VSLCVRLFRRAVRSSEARCSTVFYARSSHYFRDTRRRLHGVSTIRVERRPLLYERGPWILLESAAIRIRNSRTLCPKGYGNPDPRSVSPLPARRRAVSWALFAQCRAPVLPFADSGAGPELLGRGTR